IVADQYRKVEEDFAEIETVSTLELQPTRIRQNIAGINRWSEFSRPVEGHTDLANCGLGPLLAVDGEEGLKTLLKQNLAELVRHRGRQGNHLTPRIGDSGDQLPKV